MQARNAKVGHVDDFIADDRFWVIHLAVVETRVLLSGKSVMIPVGKIQSVLYGESRVFMGMPEHEIRELPAYNPYELVNSRLEQVYYDYEGRRYC